MPLTRPTLTQLRDRVDGDIKSALGITNILRRSLLKIFSNVWAALAHTLHGFIQNLSINLFPDTAEDEFLDQWGSIWGIIRTPATFTQLNVTFTGTDTTVIADETVIIVGGFSYLTQGSATIGSITPGEVDVVVKAALSGSTTNQDDATVMSLESPIVGVDSDVTVLSTSIEGEDSEADENYRTRIVQRIQAPPNGGAALDYVAEALAVAGVTRAWVFPLNRGLGTVDVSFVEDNEVPIIPAAPKVAEVQAAIDAFKPVTADSVVFAPVDVEINPTIQLEPNTAEVQAAAEAELEQLLLTDAQVSGSYKDAVTVNDGSILISRLREAVSKAAGEEDHIFISPTADFTVSAGEIAVLGTVTWQAIP